MMVTTMDCNGARFPALIDRLLLGSLSRRGWGKVRRHLDECKTCQRYYDRAARIERALQGGGEAAAGPWLARFADEAVAAHEKRQPRFAVLGAAAAVAAALLIVVVPRFLHQDPFQKRGGATSAATLGIRAFCIAQRADGAVEVVGSVISGPGGALATLQCPIANRIQFSVTYQGSTAGHLTIKGTDDQGVSHSYYETVPVEPGAVNQSLPWSIRLAANHHPGRVRVEASLGSLAPAEHLLLEVTP